MTFSVQRHGIAVGRLWIRWPYFEPRDLWVGCFVKQRYWEMGARHQVVYVCIIPTLVLCFDWTLKATNSQSDADRPA